MFVVKEGTVAEDNEVGPPTEVEGGLGEAFVELAESSGVELDRDSLSLLSSSLLPLVEIFLLSSLLLLFKLLLGTEGEEGVDRPRMPLGEDKGGTPIFGADEFEGRPRVARH